MLFTYALLFLPCFGCLLFPVCQRSRFFNSLRFFRKGTAKIKSFFQSAKFLSKNFQTFFSPASASAVPFGKRVQKYSIFSFPPNKITVFFQKKAIYFFTNTKYPLGPTFIEVDDDNETSVMVETSVDTVSLQST